MGEASAIGYRLFDTALGPCGVAWSGRGLTHVQLPAASREATEARLRPPGSGHEGEPPAAVLRVIDDLRRYCAGEPADFAEVVVDFRTAPPFHCRIYGELRAVRWGETVSYGELARRVGAPEAARAVGRAMALNPVPIVVPCHRVLGSDGRIGGFSAPGGAATKRRLLAMESAGSDHEAPLLALMRR